jgi:hypothetical protein
VSFAIYKDTLLSIFKLLMVIFFFKSFQYFQESPMPEPSELFTNVYAKGLGVEVLFLSTFFIYFLLSPSSMLLFLVSSILRRKQSLNAMRYQLYKLAAGSRIYG